MTCTRENKKNVRRSGSASCLHARAGVSLNRDCRSRNIEGIDEEKKRVLRATSSGRLGASGYTHV